MFFQQIAPIHLVWSIWYRTSLVQVGLTTKCAHNNHLYIGVHLTNPPYPLGQAGPAGRVGLAQVGLGPEVPGACSRRRAGRSRPWPLGS